MKIFLPPSEGKTPPEYDDGSRLDLQTLALPQLAQARTAVLESLAEVSADDQAQSILKVGTKVLAEVEANTRLSQAPVAPSSQIYTGVLFDALNPGSLTVNQRQRAAEQVRIFSGLFGVTSFEDRIPAYRLSMGVKLPDLGSLGSWWKRQLATALQEEIGDQLILDCRSSSYVTAFKPAPEQTLAVNNFTIRNGERKVVTHFAKHARGELTGMLLRAKEPVHAIDEVAEIAATRWDVEIREATAKTAHQLDLIG